MGKFTAANNCPPRVIETGAGNSTILFLMLGCSSVTSIAPDEKLGRRIEKEAADRKIDVGALTYINDRSERALPKLAFDGVQCDVAFIDHSNQGDDGGSVAVVDLSGKKKKLTRDWYGTGGLAWSPSGEEVWFTASELGVDHYLSAVSLAGKERLVARIPGTLSALPTSNDAR
jgi:hypothetical protein